MTGLGIFDGKEVASTTLAVTGTGSLMLDCELRIGDRIFVVMEAVVAAVDFKPNGGEADVTRKHVARTSAAVLVDEALVRAVLDEHAEKVLAARDAETGEQRLDFAAVGTVNGHSTSKIREHAEGKHKRKRKDCPTCQSPEGAPASVTNMETKRAKRGQK